MLFHFLFILGGSIIWTLHARNREYWLRCLQIVEVKVADTFLGHRVRVTNSLRVYYVLVIGGFTALETSCRRAAATICPRPSPPPVGPRDAEPTAPAHHNVAVGSHAQYVPTLTAAAA